MKKINILFYKGMGVFCLLLSSVMVGVASTFGLGSEEMPKSMLKIR